jgi:hypothetical protein
LRGVTSNRAMRSGSAICSIAVIVPPVNVKANTT